MLLIVQIIKNILIMLSITIFSLLPHNTNTRVIMIENKSINKNSTMMSTTIKYETIEKYNDKLPKGTEKVILNGSDGVSYEDGYGNLREIKEPINKVVEIGTGKSGKYNGDTTGYGADCKGCSGHVACKSKAGNNYNLKTDGVYYKDDQYGSIRILAADTRIFPCGTVLEIVNNTDSYLGIIMDTGSSLRTAWDKMNKIHVDVAFLSEKDPEVYTVTSRNNTVEFNVQRWGW